MKNIVLSLALKMKSKIHTCRVLFLMKREIGKRITIAVDDLLAMQTKNNELLRCDIAIRLYTMSEFLKKNDLEDCFYIYRKMQNARINETYGEKAVTQFIKLIESYEETGYDKNSRIVLDRKFNIIDGAHRIAAAIYYGIKEINAVILDIDYRADDYSIDWFFEQGFTKKETDLIQKIAKSIVVAHRPVFTGVIWGPGIKFTDEIIEDMSSFGQVFDIKVHKYSNRLEYNNIVKKIYEVDDVDQWKIEKKIIYMKSYPKRLIQFHIQYTEPSYRIKEISKQPISIMGERVKNDMRKRYRNYLDKYFFDILLHIADNSLQSSFMDTVFEPPFDVKNVLDILDNYNYAIVKTETPYYPVNFPKSIPIGKDLDIICNKEDYSSVVKRLKEYAFDIKGVNISIFENRYNLKIRIEKQDKLLIQFDISNWICGFTERFVSEALSERVVDTRGFYRIPDNLEVLVRYVSYKNDRKKTYHYDYIKKNIDKVNINQSKMYLSDGYIKGFQILYNNIREVDK